MFNSLVGNMTLGNVNDGKIRGTISVKIMSCEVEQISKGFILSHRKSPKNRDYVLILSFGHIFYFVTFIFGLTTTHKD